MEARMQTRIENNRQIWGNRSTERYAAVRELYFREGRVSGFSENSEWTGYATGLLKIVNVEPYWTVLDLACADGTLTIPLAGQAKRVTAVDYSENMLEVLKKRCSEKGLMNVRAIHGRWEDDWDTLGVGMHDVAIASWSIRADDLLDLAVKMNRIARKRVYISMAVGDGPFDRKLYEATGRKLNMGPSYTYIYYNVLHENMGILADIAFVREVCNNDWGSREEAVENQRWMFRDLTADEEEKLRVYLDNHLTYVSGRWRLSYEKECMWAVMSWNPSQGRREG
jgi:SAM-dependent methyltransferase